MPDLNDFADAMRGELAEVKGPPADDRLLDRILESRRAGTRVILPLEDGRRRPRVWLYASAVAAAAAAVVGITELTRPDGAVSFDAAQDAWFVGDLAFAQSPIAPRPAFHAVIPSRADRLHPVALHYLRTTSGPMPMRVDIHVTLQHDSVEGVRAWRAAAVRRSADGITSIDSSWVAADDLRPLRRVAVEFPYRSFERIQVQQRFDGLRVGGDMHAWKGGAVNAHRTFDRQLPAAFAPYLSDGLVPLYHMAVPLERGWVGSASVLGWAVRDNDVFVSVGMRVDGEETVHVPAGEFACWRLAMDYNGRRSWYWVRKSDGVGVRTLDSSDVRTRGVREAVLLK